MSANGQPREKNPEARVLRWSGRVLSSSDVAHSLNGHRELVLSPRTVVTPLAAEELSDRGVTYRRDPLEVPAAPASEWGYAQDRPHPLVRSAVQALERDGLVLREMDTKINDSPWNWAKALAECV